MGWLKLIFALLVAMVLVAFGAQNTASITLHFLAFKLPAAPMAFILLVAVLLGAVLAWTVSVPDRFRRRRELRGLRGQVRSASAVGGPVGEGGAPAHYQADSVNAEHSERR